MTSTGRPSSAADSRALSRSGTPSNASAPGPQRHGLAAGQHEHEAPSRPSARQVVHRRLDRRAGVERGRERADQVEAVGQAREQPVDRAAR